MGNKNNRNINHSPSILIDQEIALLQYRTGLSRQEIQTWHSQFLQDNRNGYIDRKSFEKIYKQLYPNGNREKNDADVAFKIFDTDNSGKITFSEFIMVTATPDPTQVDQKMREHLENLFNYYDFNGDGYIDRHEMNAYLVALYESYGLSRDQVHQNLEDIFRTYDQDHDNRLNRNETIEFLMDQSNN